MSERVLIWGDEELPASSGTEHFMVIGATGSGKSTLLNCLMKSVLTGDARSARALIYDAKQEMLPSLYPMAGNRVRVLHPFDRRSCSWNLAQDIDGPLSARQLAAILVPDPKTGGGDNPFFQKAVRDVIFATALAFIECVPKPKEWSFRDLILALLYEPYQRTILALRHTRSGREFPYGSRVLKTYLDSDARTASNIRASLNADLGVYETVAAAWHAAELEERTFSLRDWLRDDCSDILCLGSDESARAALDPLNQLLIRRAGELLLSRPSSDSQDQSWLFLDELPSLGYLDGLGRLATKGRSKNICLVLGFQDIVSMYSIYGENLAHEICGQCDHIAVLKLSNPTTAQWASDLFGRKLTRVSNSNQHYDSGGSSGTALGLSEEEQPFLFTADFLYLPRTSLRSGLSGFFKGPHRDPAKEGFAVELPWEKAIAPYLPERHPKADRDPQFSAYWPRPDAELYLSPWTHDDWQRLGMNEVCALPSIYDPPHQTAVEINTAPRSLGQVRRNS